MDKQKYYYWFLGLILFTGIAIRTILYLYNRSFWLDESFLVLFTVDLPYENFFFKMSHPFASPQAAAPFFMVISKFMTQTFGTDEKVFRFFPFLCSLLSLPVFYFLANKFLEKRYSVLIALLLFAINFRLLNYAQEFKQYGSDVLFVMIVILIFCNLKLENYKKIIGWALVLCSLFWFSHPAAFTIAFSGLVFLILNFNENKKKLFAFFAPLFINGLVFGIHALTISQNSFLKNYWKDAFIYNIKDFSLKIQENFQYFFHPNHSFCLYILFCLGFGIIIWQMFKKKDFKSLYLLVPLIATVVLASLKLYPFEQRLILFSIPIILIILIKPLDRYKLMATILLFMSFWHYLYKYPMLNRWSYTNEELRPLSYVLKHYLKPDDIVYITASSLPQIIVYNRFLDIGVYNHVKDKEIMPFGHPENARLSLEELQVGKKYWLISANIKPDLVQVNDVIKDFVANKCRIIMRFDFKVSTLWYVEKIKE